jgi:pyruvate/2-oxoglutarate dehydrogenase complex dihydrolipoamide acyltransferase (E2) component
MMNNFKTLQFPRSRIATIDVCEIGKQKHHVTAFIELDVTVAREKIRVYRRNVGKASFNGWLLGTIAKAVSANESAAAFLRGKQKMVIFEDINISMVVEKRINGQQVPIPMIIEKAQKTSIESITLQIEDAKNQPLDAKDVVLRKKAQRLERLYYHLPGFARRLVWKYMLSHPKTAYKKMGNVAVTSIGMMGRVNGWFLPISIHPVCFGISTINKKPVVIDDQIMIREILNMTILFDHDVMDGANMARFISELSTNIEKGAGL